MLHSFLDRIKPVGIYELVAWATILGYVCFEMFSISIQLLVLNNWDRNTGGLIEILLWYILLYLSICSCFLLRIKRIREHVSITFILVLIPVSYLTLIAFLLLKAQGFFGAYASDVGDLPLVDFLSHLWGK
jgi:glucan phosphoethanolaminetransferase (alkaline phosphatase superfamily)